MTDTIPVFLNERLVRVPAGSTVSELIAAHAADLAAEAAGGQLLVTDARGLALPGETPVAAGLVLRVFRSARTGSDPADG